MKYLTSLIFLMLMFFLSQSNSVLYAETISARELAKLVPNPVDGEKIDVTRGLSLAMQDAFTLDPSKKSQVEKNKAEINDFWKEFSSCTLSGTNLADVEPGLSEYLRSTMGSEGDEVARKLLWKFSCKRKDTGETDLIPFIMSVSAGFGEPLSAKMLSGAGTMIGQAAWKRGNIQYKADLYRWPGVRMLPKGSYQRSCLGCWLKGTKLICSKCLVADKYTDETKAKLKPQGEWVKESSIDLATLQPGQGVANCDGTLTPDTSKGCPVNENEVKAQTAKDAKKQGELSKDLDQIVETFFKKLKSGKDKFLQECSGKYEIFKLPNGVWMLGCKADSGKPAIKILALDIIKDPAYTSFDFQKILNGMAMFGLNTTN